MGIAIPQVVTEDRASGAQIIDGSLKFDSSSSQHLTKTFTSAGNRRIWTHSSWVKRGTIPSSNVAQSLFGAYSDSSNRDVIRINGESQDTLSYQNGISADYDSSTTSALLRDTGWYHFVISFDSNQATQANRVKIYVNGQLQSKSNNSQLTRDSIVNGNYLHLIGARSTDGTGSTFFDGSMSQVYLIDGLALGPEYFGYTDPLTNTWRPKKFKAEGTTVNDGTVWSAGAGANFDSGNPATNGFDGNSASIARTDNANVTATVTFSKPIPFANLVVRGAIETGGIIKVNGVDVSSQYTSGTSTLQSVDLTQVNGVSSPLTSISLTGVGGAAQPRFSEIVVDGVVMQDSTTQNLDFGTNGFYLPMDGNSLIGEDQSGKGNNWTPSGFGGSVALDNPSVSGARPILNTDGGGNVARPGVFGSNENRFYKTTSATNSGGKYVFENEGTQPTFNFIRGATYSFDYNASTGHPLRFATAADAAGSTQYTDGTEVNSNVIQITVPHNAPDTLYYYCTNHGNMGNSISVTTDETKADKYASSVVLACPYAGSKDDFSGEINCTVSNKGSDNYGSIQKGKTGSFYSSSRSFDGSNDNINYSSSSTLGFDGAFTIEMYASPCPNDSSPICSKGYYSASTGNWYFRFSNANGGTMTFYSYNGQGGGQQNSFTNLGCTDTNRMYHVVAQRNSSNLMTFLLDGVIVAQASNVTRDLTDGASSGLSVGRIASGNSSNAAYYWYNGNISDLRIYKGIDKYDVSGKSVGDQVFVPASTNPDILPDTPSGVSGSSKLAKITEGAVSFDGSGDYLSIGSSSDFAYGTGDFTIEFFVYLTKTGQQHFYEGRRTNESNRLLINVNGNTEIAVFANGGYRIEGQVLETNRWYHISFSRSGTSSKLFVDGVQTGSTYSDSIDYAAPTDFLYLGSNDLGSGSSVGGFLSNFRIVKGTALYTTNFTPPTEPLTAVTNTKLLCCQSNTSAGGGAVLPSGTINNGTVWSDGADPALDNFDGIQAIFDGSLTTRGGDTNTAYLTYVNNVSISASTGIRIYYNGIGSGQRYIRINGTTELDDGSAALTPGWSSVSSFSGTINKIEIKTANTGSFAVSAIEIDGTILIDPVNGNAAATNFNPFNTDINTVRGQETGYCTLNPLSTSVAVLSDGNLLYGGGSGMHCVGSTFAVSSGRWYWESFVEPTGNYFYTGIADVSTKYTTNWCGSNTGWSVSVNSAGNICYNNAENQGSIGINIATGQIWGWALDMDAGTFKVYVDGIIRYSGNSIIPGATSLSGRTVTPATGHDDGRHLTYNFGQKPFKFPPPDGFQPLNAANLRPETVIARPDQFVSATIWSGDSSGSGGTTKIIETQHQPDFVWIKQRNQAYSTGHQLYDSVRGAGAEKELDSSSNHIEGAGNINLWGWVNSFDKTGFTTKGGPSGYDYVNVSGVNYVAWSWKAGGNKGVFNKDDVGYASAAAAGLTGGTITPTGSSVGTKQGFSIISWTGNETAGATIPHGLGKTPGFAIFKSRETELDWGTYHQSLGATKRVILNSDATASADPNAFNNTEPTSSIITLGASDVYNDDKKMIAYVWCDVPGLQKFGSYTSNNNSDGPFIELGFRPAIIWIKVYENHTNDWAVYDTTRETSNPSSKTLYLNLTSIEDTGGYYYIDVLSNGFKLRNSYSKVNGATNYKYIYCAWAEAPAFNLYGAQSNAR